MSASAPLSPPQASRALALLARADGVFGTRGVSQAVPHRKAIVFTGVSEAKAQGAPVDEAAAQRAVDALRRCNEIIQKGGIPLLEDLPAKADVEALEICIRFMRPALLVEGGHVKLDPQLEWVAWTGSQKAMVEAALPAIGSIGFLTSQDPFTPVVQVGIATCFVIGPRAVVTNVHVVEQIAHLGRRLDETVVRFDVERDPVARFEAVPIKGELGRCQGQDVVVLETVKDCPAAGLPMLEKTKIEPLTAIVAIGHPLQDARNPAWAQVMFENKFGVKRVSPGVIIGVEGEKVVHDASTLGGNSGSPLLDLATGQVVAVHSLGEFALQNEAVGSGAIAAEPGLKDRVSQWV